jgi:hypothetical protein
MRGETAAHFNYGRDNLRLHRLGIVPSRIHPYTTSSAGVVFRQQSIL